MNNILLCITFVISTLFTVQASTVTGLKKPEQLYQLKLLKKQQIPQDIIAQYFNILNDKSYEKNSNIIISLPKVIVGSNYNATFEIKNTSKNNQLYIFAPALRNPFIIKIKDLKHADHKYRFSLSHLCRDHSDVEIYAILKDENNNISINKAMTTILIGAGVDNSPQCATYYSYSVEYIESKSEYIDKLLSEQNKNISFNNETILKVSKDGRILLKSRSHLVNTKEYIEKVIFQEDGEDSIRLKLSENIKKLSFKLPASKSAKIINAHLKFTDGKELVISPKKNKPINNTEITKKIVPKITIVQNEKNINNLMKKTKNNPINKISYIVNDEKKLNTQKPNKDSFTILKNSVRKNKTLKWLSPKKIRCEANNGKFESGICMATWEDAKNICYDIGSHLPNKNEYVTVITECGGNIIVDFSSTQTENVTNQNYQNCYKEKGFNFPDSTFFWSTKKDVTPQPYLVSFYNGFVGRGNGKSLNNVRCLK